jgi:hypothetical protein
MSDLLIEPRHRPGSRPRPSVALLFIAAIAAAIVIAAEVAPASPRFVRAVTISNPSPFLVETQVARPDRTGWLALGAVDPGRRQAFGEVFDLGETWVFRFSYAGVVGAEFTERRSALAAGDWRIDVPADAVATFQAAGLHPSAGGR